MLTPRGRRSVQSGCGCGAIPGGCCLLAVAEQPLSPLQEYPGLVPPEKSKKEATTDCLHGLMYLFGTPSPPAGPNNRPTMVAVPDACDDAALCTAAAQSLVHVHHSLTCSDFSSPRKYMLVQQCRTCHLVSGAPWATGIAVSTPRACVLLVCCCPPHPIVRMLVCCCPPHTIVRLAHAAPWTMHGPSSMVYMYYGIHWTTDA